MSKQDTEYEIVVNSLKGNLPSIPVVMNELMTVISDHDAALYALRDLLKMDHSIFAQLLRVANTHEHRQGLSSRITGIDDAVQILGLEKVKRIALNTTILTLFKGANLPVEFSLESLWLHSVGVALASSTLAEELNTGMEDQAYTCGLLHDLGKVAKCKFDQKLFSKHLKSTWDKNLDCHDWETQGKTLIVMIGKPRGNISDTICLAVTWPAPGGFLRKWKRSRSGTMRKTVPNGTTSKTTRSRNSWTSFIWPTARFTALALETVDTG